MMRFSGGVGSIFLAHRFLQSKTQTGVAFLEFAVLTALLTLLLVVATDYSLAILARQEIHSAARAGMEVAIDKGFDAAGIEAAARNPRGATVAGLRFASTTSVSATVTCACYAQFPGVSPELSGGVLSCTNAKIPLCDVPSGVTGVKVSRSPYVTVVVNGAYTPYFSWQWPNLVDGKVVISAKYVGKTYFK